MPWTDVRTLQQGARIVERAARDNGGILVDPIHFDRGGNVASDIATVAASRFHYAQLCDAPAERPKDIDTLLFQARAERLMPGDGALDLAGILRALPANLPLGMEVPMESLSRRLGAVDRARAILDKARALLDSL
jgi:sugar phosphate isomerase/epimerase